MILCVGSGPQQVLDPAHAERQLGHGLGGNKNRVVTGQGAQDAQLFPAVVQGARQQLGRAGAGAHDDQAFVGRHADHQIGQIQQRRRRGVQGQAVDLIASLILGFDRLELVQQA